MGLILESKALSGLSLNRAFNQTRPKVLWRKFFVSCYYCVHGSLTQEIRFLTKRDKIGAIYR